MREDGSSLVELLVAATLGVLALGILLGGAVAPLQRVAALSTPDADARALDGAGEVFTRVVRAARTGLDDHAIERLTDEELIVRIVDGSTRSRVRLALDGGSFTVTLVGSDVAPSSLPNGTIVEELERDGSGLEGLDRHGEVVPGDDRARVRSVRLRLAKGSETIERIVRLRLLPFHGGVRGW